MGAPADQLTGGFVGRAAELERLGEAAERVRGGEPWSVLVEGESGIGKTWLVRRALAELAEFTVLTAACDPSEQDLPYGVITQLTARVPQATTAALPALRGHIPDGTPPFRVGGQLLTLLGDLQAEQPVALVVDDVQWADRASVLALGFVLRRLYADRVLTVLVSRSGTEAGEHAEEIRRLVGSVAHATDLHVRGLAEQEIARLGDGLELPGWSGRSAAALHRQTGGHPLYVRMLLGELRASGTAANAPQVPDRLAATVRRRIAALAPVSRRLLEAMAVLDTRCPLATAATVAGIGNPTGALDQLVGEGLVVWWPEEPSTPIEVRHQLLRDVVYRQLPPGRRRELHAAAAPLVDRITGFRHRVAAAELTDPALAAELEAAGRDLIDVGDIGQAATYLLWAADLAASRAEYERLLLTAAIHLLIAEHFARAQSIRAAVRACSPAPLLDCINGRYAMVDGALTAAEELLTRTLDAAQDRPDLAWEAALAGHWLASIHNWRGDGARTIEAATAAGASGLLHPYVGEYTRHFRSVGRLYLDGPVAAMAELATDTGGFALSWRGGLHMMAGNLSEATADLVAATQGRTGGFDLEATFLSHYFLAHTRMLTGDWESAAINVDLAITAGEVNDYAWAHAPAHALAARLAAARGAHPEAEHHLAVTEHWYDTVGPEAYAVYPAMAQAALAQARGDHPAMCAATDRIAALPANGRRRGYRLLWEPERVEALIGTGRLDEAAVALAELEELDAPALRAARAWLAGWLAHARGRLDLARQRYAEELARPAAADDIPLFRARLRHGHGLLLRAMGERRAAIDNLRVAAEGYAALGAEPFLRRCSADLAACGLAPAAHGRDVRARLTERERGIAHLVATGRSNQEVSGELYISVKTVEYHLSNVYAKLGVSSRRELAPLLLS